VEVETPEGIKTGSAVREVSASSGVKVFQEESGASVHVRGEAVVVDLGKRGALFALLRGKKLGDDYGYGIVFNAFGYRAGSLTPEGIRYFSQKTGSVVLEPENYPQLVRFRDLHDPMSVEEITVETTNDNSAKQLEEAFGSGVKIKQITLEMTKDDVTSEIAKWLPWLSAIKGGYLHGGPTGRGAPLGLYGSHFRK
jgi:hypothetical protein